MEKFLNKMERKFGRYAISGLMKYICVLYIIGLFINIASPQVYYYYLSLNPYRILHGEVWRLVTFLIQSPNSNVIFFIFTLYLYYMLGQTLERVWGRLDLTCIILQVFYLPLSVLLPPIS